MINKLLLDSWLSKEGINKTEHILEWINNGNIFVDIKKTNLSNIGWFYNETSGQITNSTGSFFQIAGIREGLIEQPIMIQNEIGYLGIICKIFGGVLHCLMYAKIEPGNINKIQISPTIQATKSNFTQKHGGVTPAYLDCFINASYHHIIIDQIQSEQSSRFFKKRNRNIMILIEDDIEETQTHKWMTIGQIKHLMRFDNLVNMNTRTVLSCIPLYNGLNSNSIYQYFNDYKMFKAITKDIIPLYSLKRWKMQGNEESFICLDPWHFKIIFCDISIEGREVKHWGQPLFEAEGMAIFGLFSRVNNGVREFLVQAKHEIGCFDEIELGPTVQLEAIEKPSNEIEKLFIEYYDSKIGIKYDVILSEEGGRFYHEQNKNIIIEIEAELIKNPPPGYWWCTYKTLNELVQINNMLNIQLRNLLSLLEVDKKEDLKEYCL